MTTHYSPKLTEREVTTVLAALDLYIQEVEDGTGERCVDGRRALAKIKATYHAEPPARRA